MIHEVGERLLNGAEKKFGKLAIPGLLKWIAGFQALTFLLAKISPDYISYLTFDLDKILLGEVWRLVSWVFTPGTTSFIFIIFATLFMFFISDSLENVWGPFRLNVYVLLTCVLLGVAGMIVPTIFLLSKSYEQAVYGFMNGMLYSSAFLAFAATFPNQIINLMGVIPVKAKWLGLANAAILIAIVIGGWVLSFVVLIGLAPFLLVFAPTFFKEAKQRSDSASRRVAFKSKTEMNEAFHTCDACGKTDVSDPEQEFRVTATGDEYCLDCLPKQAGSE